MDVLHVILSSCLLPGGPQWSPREGADTELLTSPAHSALSFQPAHAFRLRRWALQHLPLAVTWSFAIHFPKRNAKPSRLETAKCI